MGTYPSFEVHNILNKQIVQKGTPRRAVQIKTTKFRTYVQIRSTLRTLYPNMDKKSLDKYSSVYPTYLPKKFGHFGIKVCSISNFPHKLDYSFGENGVRKQKMFNSPYGFTDQMS